MDKRNLAFDRTNFILLGIGFAIVVIGFILMSGSSSSEQAFNPDIFSVRRIKVAPVVCFVGFVSMIYAIIRKPKDSGDGSEMGIGQDPQAIDTTQEQNA
jgi:Protein of unknown function (DUF3098).